MFFAYTLSNLSLGRPDVLDEAVALGQAVQGIVGLTHGADEAAQGVDVVLAGDSTAGLVHLGDGNLNGSVVLGLDDTVGGRALAGDVTIGRGGRSVHRVLVFTFRRILPTTLCCGRFHQGRLQVHDLATVVLHCEGWG